MSALLDLLPGTFSQSARTNGGEFVGPCPWCGGDDRFLAWPSHPKSESGRFWCRRCEEGGDGIDLHRRLHGSTFAAAAEALGASHLVTGESRPPAPPPPPPIAEPPPADWQRDAEAYVDECEAAMWTDAGRRGVDYLAGRGLTNETIRSARLGVCRRGITFPWFVGGVLWAVRIRLWEPRPDGSRYISRKGSKSGTALYGADELRFGAPAVLVEGELDALSVRQSAGVAAVATGGTMGAHRLRWTVKLAVASDVLVSFDADEPGENASAYWLERLPAARRWRPYWSDPSAMLQDGADLARWVAAGLAASGSEAPVEAPPRLAVDPADLYRDTFGAEALADLDEWGDETRARVLWLWAAGLTSAETLEPRLAAGRLRVADKAVSLAEFESFLEALREGPAGPASADVRARLPLVCDGIRVLVHGSPFAA